MVIVHELKEPIPVETKVGKGVAIFVEIGANDNRWTVILESRAIVTFPQNKILVQRDFTNGRGVTAEMLKAVIERVTGDETNNKGKSVQNTEESVDTRVYETRRCSLRGMLHRASCNASSGWSTGNQGRSQRKKLRMGKGASNRTKTKAKA